MIRVLHTSDLHGRRSKYKALLNALATEAIDVWVDTGDFFPNRYWDYRRGDVSTEVTHQSKWWRRWKGLDERIMGAIQANPYPLQGILSVGGNHDYANLCLLLGRARQRFAPQSTFPIMEASTEVQTINVAGRDWTFQGSRLIPPTQIITIFPPWRGEANEFVDIKAEVDLMQSKAKSVDLLLTHAPRFECLDAPGDRGVRAFHQLHAHVHFHGHVHGADGMHVAPDDVCKRTFVINGATKLMIYTINKNTHWVNLHKTVLT